MKKDIEKQLTCDHLTIIYVTVAVVIPDDLE